MSFQPTDVSSSWYRENFHVRIQRKLTASHRGGPTEPKGRNWTDYEANPLWMTRVRHSIGALIVKSGVLYLFIWQNWTRLKRFSWAGVWLKTERTGCPQHSTDPAFSERGWWKTLKRWIRHTHIPTQTHNCCTVKPPLKWDKTQWRMFIIMIFQIWGLNNV